MRQHRNGLRNVRPACPHVSGVAAVCVALASLLLASGVAEAQIQPVPGLSRSARSSGNQPQQTVRLNFFNESWPDVLKAVAEGTDSQLVMDETSPRGRFTRQDFRTYSRTDAVRILNRELEPQGFRLLEREQYLVLLHVKNLREEYGVRTIPAAQPVAAQEPIPESAPLQPSAAQPAAARHRETHTVTPTAAAETTRLAVVRGEASAPPRSAKPDVRAIPFYETASDKPSTALLEVPLRNRTAADVARSVYGAYRKEAELVDVGPSHLPAFVVYTGGSAGRTQDYAVGIDEQRDQLVIEASRPRAVQIEELIRALDVPEDREVAQVHRTAMPGRQLASALQEIADQATGGAGEQAAPLPPVPPAPGVQAAPDAALIPGQTIQPGATMTGPGGVPLRLELQGPVTIRDIPGVGLVVTGNRADVDTVLDAIKKLEVTTGGAAANVHLLMLRNVNSEALAELLNTVYESLTELRKPLATDLEQWVQVIAVVKPNAVLILASERDLPGVLELANKLDQPVDPATEFEVFHLKHAVADQVVTSLESFYEEREPLGTRISAFADIRTNSVIVQARGSDLAEIARLVEKIDQDTSQAVNRMQIFMLKHATASTLATTINQAIQSVNSPPTTVTSTTGQTGGMGQGSTGSTPEELRTPRSSILELVAGEGGVEQLVRSGILADIRVTADVSRNALIVTAPEMSMRLMAELIAQLDLPTPLVAEIKVFTLANSDASVMVELLEELFETTTQSTSTTSGSTTVQLAGAEDAGSTLIPLRFSVDARTNSVVAVGSADSLRIVEAILLRLDESDLRKRRTVVRKLLNSPASDVASAVNEFLSARRELADIDEELITNLDVLEQEVIVVAETVTNSLLVSATPRYYDEVMDMIERLDEKPAEVVIQALLVEVELDNTDEFGVQLGFQDSVLFNRSVDGTPGFNFNNQALGEGVVDQSHVGTQGLTDFALSRVNSDLGFGGMVLAASSDAVNVLIRALSAQRTLHVLSRPTIRTLDNQEASIQVGQQVPIVEGASVGTTGTITPEINQQEVGIILSVTPRISPDGAIVMEVVATKSELSDEGVPVVIDATSDTTVESPIINITQAETTISTPNGQTVVLGGMITKRDEAFEQKVPWLGDIPYVGLAFRYDGVATSRTELLIFLTPRVIRNEADSELIKRVEAERVHFIESDAEEIHGPLYSAPQPCPEFGPGATVTPDAAYPDAAPTDVPQNGDSGPQAWDQSGAPTSALPTPNGAVRPIQSGTLRNGTWQPAAGAGAKAGPAMAAPAPNDPAAAIPAEELVAPRPEAFDASGN